jgi:hypothetical protein
MAVWVVGLKAPSVPFDGKRVHTPPWQVWPALQAAPQPPPQRVRESTSQPLAALPSQSEKLVRHATSAQRPATQAPTPLVKVQAVPHPPQLAASLVRSRHVPEQLVRPVPQVTTQALPEHT